MCILREENEWAGRNKELPSGVVKNNADLFHSVSQLHSSKDRVVKVKSDRKLIWRGAC